MTDSVQIINQSGSSIEIVQQNSSIELAFATSGPKGLSAYQIAVQNGFIGTEAEWIADLSTSTITTDLTQLYNIYKL